MDKLQIVRRGNKITARQDGEALWTSESIPEANIERIIKHCHKIWDVVEVFVWDPTTAKFILQGRS